MQICARDSTLSTIAKNNTQTYVMDLLRALYQALKYLTCIIWLPYGLLQKLIQPYNNITNANLNRILTLTGEM